jgi:hypothetical protein
MPEWTVLAIYTLADAQTIPGPAVGVLFHVYNTPDCIYFEFKWVHVETNLELNSSPIFLSLSDSWKVTISTNQINSL